MPQLFLRPEPSQFLDLWLYPYRNTKADNFEIYADAWPPGQAEMLVVRRKLTETREITDYKRVHPDEER
jgi:hypothetical protein